MTIGCSIAKQSYATKLQFHDDDDDDEGDDEDEEDDDDEGDDEDDEDEDDGAAEATRGLPAHTRFCGCPRAKAEMLSRVVSAMLLRASLVKKPMWPVMSTLLKLCNS